jgi:hypothetical protein
LVPDNLYEEFYDIKITSMKLTQRFIQIESKTDADSVLEKQMINEKFEELSDRLNNLL